VTSAVNEPLKLVLTVMMRSSESFSGRQAKAWRESPNKEPIA
jgi:hypothetical protein